jgi:hypothetical protein
LSSHHLIHYRPYHHISYIHHQTLLITEIIIGCLFVCCIVYIYAMDVGRISSAGAPGVHVPLSHQQNTIRTVAKYQTLTIEPAGSGGTTIAVAPATTSSATAAAGERGAVNSSNGVNDKQSPNKVTSSSLVVSVADVTSGGPRSPNERKSPSQGHNHKNNNTATTTTAATATATGLGIGNGINGSANDGNDASIATPTMIDALSPSGSTPSPAVSARGTGSSTRGHHRPTPSAGLLELPLNTNDSKRRGSSGSEPGSARNNAFAAAAAGGSGGNSPSNHNMINGGNGSDKGVASGRNSGTGLPIHINENGIAANGLPPPISITASESGPGAIAARAGPTTNSPGSTMVAPITASPKPIASPGGVIIDGDGHSSRRRTCISFFAR